MDKNAFNYEKNLYKNNITDSSITDKDNLLRDLYFKVKNNYSTYLKQNKNSIKLLIDNGTLETIKASDYLNNQDENKNKKINKKKLTLIPYISTRNIKSERQKKELTKLERSAVCLRRIEYSTRMKQNKIIIKYGNKINKIILIQKYFRGYLMRSIINDVKNLKFNIQKFINHFTFRYYIIFIHKLKQFRIKEKKKKNKSKSQKKKIKNENESKNQNKNINNILDDINNNDSNTSKKIYISKIENPNNTYESQNYKTNNKNNEEYKDTTIIKNKNKIFNQLTEIHKNLLFNNSNYYNERNESKKNILKNNNNSIPESISNSEKNFVQNVLTVLNKNEKNDNKNESSNKENTVFNNFNNNEKQNNYNNHSEENKTNNNNSNYNFQSVKNDVNGPITINISNKDLNIDSNSLSNTNKNNKKNKHENKRSTKHNFLKEEFHKKSSRKLLHSQLPANKFIQQKIEKSFDEYSNQTIDYFINRFNHHYLSDDESDLKIIADNFITPVPKINYDSSYERTNTLFSNFNKSIKKTEEDNNNNYNKNRNINDKIPEEENYKIIENFDISEENFNKNFSNSNHNSKNINSKKNSFIKNNINTSNSHNSKKYDSSDLLNTKSFNKLYSDKTISTNKIKSDKNIINDRISSKFNSDKNIYLGKNINKIQHEDEKNSVKKETIESQFNFNKNLFNNDINSKNIDKSNSTKKKEKAKINGNKQSNLVLKNSKSNIKLSKNSFPIPTKSSNHTLTKLINYDNSLSNHTLSKNINNTKVSFPKNYQDRKNSSLNKLVKSKLTNNNLFPNEPRVKNSSKFHSDKKVMNFKFDKNQKKSNFKNSNSNFYSTININHNKTRNNNDNNLNSNLTQTKKENKNNSKKNMNNNNINTQNKYNNNKKESDNYTKNNIKNLDIKNKNESKKTVNTKKNQNIAQILNSNSDDEKEIFLSRISDNIPINSSSKNEDSKLLNISNDINKKDLNIKKIPKLDIEFISKEIKKNIIQENIIKENFDENNNHSYSNDFMTELKPEKYDLINSFSHSIEKKNQNDSIEDILNDDFEIKNEFNQNN